MVVYFKKTNVEAIIPCYAHADDAGMDLFSINEYIIKPSDTCLVQTGLVIELPQNTEAQIRPRSGLALNHGITVLNSPGTIDCGYRGEIGVILINHGKQDYVIKKGSKIAQIVIKPVIHACIEEKLDLNDNTERGENGFGSSG